MVSSRKHTMLHAVLPVLFSTQGNFPREIDWQLSPECSDGYNWTNDKDFSIIIRKKVFHLPLAAVFFLFPSSVNLVINK